MRLTARTDAYGALKFRNIRPIDRGGGEEEGEELRTLSLIPKFANADNREDGRADGEKRYGGEGGESAVRRGWEWGTAGEARACLPIIKFKSTQRKTKRLFSPTGWKLQNTRELRRQTRHSYTRHIAPG